MLTGLSSLAKFKLDFIVLNIQTITEYISINNRHFLCSLCSRNCVRQRRLKGLQLKDETVELKDDFKLLLRKIRYQKETKIKVKFICCKISESFVNSLINNNSIQVYFRLPDYRLNNFQNQTTS